MQSPLTQDYRAIEIFLDSLSTDLIPVQGTAIGEALKTSIDAFSDTPFDARAVILITDGEDHSGDMSAIAEMARKEGVKIFIIGIGTTEGAPIPNAKGGFLKSASGELVLTRLNEAALSQIAVETGGSYVKSVAGDLDLEKIYFGAIKGSTDSQDLRASRKKLWNEQFQWFVAIVLLCFALEPLLSDSSKKRANIKEQYGR